MVGEIRVIAVRGIGEVRPGEDLATTILDALARQDLPLADGDVLVVTQDLPGGEPEPQPLDGNFLDSLHAHPRPPRSPLRPGRRDI